MDMLKTVKQAFKVPEMRAKIYFTMIMLIVFRIGSNIPVPGIDRSVLDQIFTGENSGLFSLFDLFSGGSFSQFTIFALSITPYVTASIIVQLLTVAFPYFERLAQEGTEGRRKMAQITRYMTVVLAVIQAVGLTLGMFRRAVDPTAFNFIVIILVLTAGTSFLMWLGEQINENGIGDGISILIFGGIVARIPTSVRSMAAQYRDGSISIVTILLFIVFAVAVVVGIIWIQQGTRKIPVQYAKRVVGRKMYGGQSTHIPLKVNQAGVIPVIFAISLLEFPLTISYFLKSDSGFTTFVNKWLSPNGNPGVWVFAVLNIVLIIFFNYFYTGITFNPVEIAQNMKQNGGFIPGIRPGRPTIDYLSRIMSRISIVGALFLAAVSTIPTLVSAFTPLNVSFGGTSLLIMVGVAIDMMNQIQNQMLVRNYRGFLK